MKDKNYGKITTPVKAFLREHEKETARSLAMLGKNVEFLQQSFVSKTPDIKMDGLFWEIKSPIGTGNKTIEYRFRRALKQSNNIIFDLQRIPLKNQNKIIDKIKKEIVLRHQKINKVLVITKNKKLIELK